MGANGRGKMQPIISHLIKWDAKEISFFFFSSNMSLLGMVCSTLKWHALITAPSRHLTTDNTNNRNHFYILLISNIMHTTCVLYFTFQRERVKFRVLLIDSGFSEPKCAALIANSGNAAPLESANFTLWCISHFSDCTSWHDSQTIGLTANTQKSYKPLPIGSLYRKSIEMF